MHNVLGLMMALQARTVEKHTLIGEVTGEQGVPTVFVDADRIPFAKLDGPNITLAFMADDKAHVSTTVCRFTQEITRV